MTRGWVKVRRGDFDLYLEWSVEPGSVLVLFGPSGSGKTMTLRAIAGLIRPDEGYIEVGSATVYDSNEGVFVPPDKRRIGYVPQEYHLFPHLDVSGNVGFGLDESSKDAKRGRITQLTKLFGIGGLEKRRIWELSGGQRQRVALARAMAANPSVLLLDEPFSALDIEVRRQVRRELRSILKESGLPVILVTHDREDAISLGGKVQIIDNGRTVAVGDPVDMLGYPQQERVARLVGVENVFELAVSEVYASEGFMICSKGPFQLEVPLADAKQGDTVSVAVRARDVILASTEPTGLSALNLIPGIVESVDTHGPTYEVTIDCGVKLKSHVTRRAINNLQISQGSSLWAVIKASSCFILADRHNNVSEQSSKINSIE